MGTVSWASGGGPLAGYAAGYRRELERRGFSPRTVRGHLGVMGQLDRWLAAARLSAADLAVARAGQFFAARRAAGQRRVPAMQTLAPLFAYLQDQQVLPTGAGDDDAGANLWGAKSRAEHLISASTLGTRALSPRLCVHGPVVRLAVAARAERHFEGRGDFGVTA